MRVGNWTLYNELVEEYWESLNSEITSFIVDITETLLLWNVTVSTYWPNEYLVGTTVFSYSKSNGVLNYGNYTRVGGGTEGSLAITRIESTPVFQNVLIISGVTIAAVSIIIILIVRRRK